MTDRYNSPIDWSDHIIDNGHTDALATGMPENGSSQCSVLEVTLKYPRTAQFIKLDQRGQCMFYKRIWEAVKLKYNDIICEDEINYEHFKSGQIHIHGYITIKPTVKFFVSGLISDFAKAFMKFIPVQIKYQSIRLWDDKYYNDVFKRYQTAYINIQFTDNKERFLEWCNYIRKENYKPV